MSARRLPPGFDALLFTRFWHRPVSRASLLPFAAAGFAAVVGWPGMVPCRFRPAQRAAMGACLAQLAQATDDHADGMPEADARVRRLLAEAEAYRRANAWCFAPDTLARGEWQDSRALPAGFTFDADGFPVSAMPGGDRVVRLADARAMRTAAWPARDGGGGGDAA